MLLLSLYSLLTGCGSGTGSEHISNQGRVQLSISWSDKDGGKAITRYIPPYARSMFFELYLKSAPNKRYKLTVNRPSDKPSTQTVAFDQLLNEGTYVLAGAARVWREKERVMHFPRRVANREIQLGEIEIIALDIRSFGDREAQIGENRGDLVDHLADRVDAPAQFRRLARRQRDVDALGGKAGV